MDNKRLDEAVEVALNVQPFTDEDSGLRLWQCLELRECEARTAMRAALLASLPVLLGDPVAWQYRERPQWDSSRGWSGWRNCNSGFHLVDRSNEDEWSYEFRTLYAPSLGEGDGPQIAP